jgi:hypothetical protein
MPMDVHQCPRCELRFANRAELQDHFAHDHHADPETFDRYRYAGRSAAPAPEVRRYLLVANQTLTDDRVIDEVRERAEQGSAQVFVLVPATHSAHHVSPPRGAAAPDASQASDDVGLAQARWRLRSTIDRLQEAGITAEGRIGHPDPYRAVTRLLEDESFDEILLSTLPPGASRWLDVDLPTRLQRRCGVPVTTLTPAAA